MFPLLQGLVAQDKICATMMKYMSKDTLVRILIDNKLSTKTELDVVEMLLSWLEIQKENFVTFPDTTEFLQLIRWPCINSNMMKPYLINSSLAGSKEFMNKVIEYNATGNHFRGLKTLPRPSTGEELDLVFLMHTGKGDKFSEKFYKISLSNSKDSGEMPTQLTNVVQT